jgi:hypothetical protein
MGKSTKMASDLLENFTVENMEVLIFTNAYKLRRLWQRSSVWLLINILRFIKLQVVVQGENLIILFSWISDTDFC